MNSNILSGFNAYETNSDCESTDLPAKGRRHETLDEVDFTRYSKLAVWFGSEAQGISELAVRHSEICVSIPMFGMIESLNLGTTSGIVLYEVTKQRREYVRKYKKRNKRAPLAHADRPFPGKQSPP